MDKLRVLSALVCAIFLFSLVLIPVARADWIMFHAETSHSGIGTGNSPLSIALLWKYNTGGEVYASPAVVGGVVYVGSNDGNVYALNATSGIKLWNFATSNIIFSSPAVVGGVVYVGSDDDYVYALNATSGIKLWSYSTGNAVESSPAVVGGVVYVGSYGGNVYALNASSKSFDTLFIIIGVIIAVVVIGTVVFLMSIKRLKAKPNSPPTTTNSISSVQISQK